MKGGIGTASSLCRAASPLAPSSQSTPPATSSIPRPTASSPAAHRRRQVAARCAQAASLRRAGHAPRAPRRREHHHRRGRDQREDDQGRDQPRRHHGGRWVRPRDCALAHRGRRRHGVHAGHRSLDGTANPTIIGALAADVVSEAIVRAVSKAESLGWLPAARELGTVPSASSSRLNLHLALLIVYSFGVIGLGIWTARFVRSSSAFFVAGRSLGPGLILSSMLAANIGAGSTLGGDGTGVPRRPERVVVGRVGRPRLADLRRHRRSSLVDAGEGEHDFYTTGDYLEFRYGPAVRGVATALVGRRFAGAAGGPVDRWRRDSRTSLPACRGGSARRPAARS